MRQEKICSQCGNPYMVSPTLRGSIYYLDSWCPSCFGSLFPGDIAFRDVYYEWIAQQWREQRARKKYEQGLKRAKSKLWLCLQLLRIKQLAPWFILVLPDHCKVTN